MERRAARAGRHPVDHALRPPIHHRTDPIPHLTRRGRRGLAAGRPTPRAAAAFEVAVGRRPMPTWRGGPTAAHRGPTAELAELAELDTRRGSASAAAG